MLKFLGRGSAFADEHNCAFFTQDQDFVLLDCPATAFQKVKKMHLDSFRRICILVTHTHGDHIGGIGMLLQYVWFVLHRKIMIIAPSDAVKSDLLLLLLRIEGCEPEWFEICTAEEFHAEWLVSAIPTTHARTLEDKCFGWHLKIRDRDVIYTGDTATLAPFLPLLHPGSVFYTEISYYKSDVHLHMDHILPDLVALSRNGVTIYLMHLDDETKISEIIENTGNTTIRLAPLQGMDS